jgi:hypothetical protein
LILFNLNGGTIFCQVYPENTYSYGIWISEYQKGWIDSKNSFWLIESPRKFEDIKSQKLEISYLCRQFDFVSEGCCKDKNYDNKNGLIHTGSAFEVRQFFDSRKAIKIKVGSKTIRIIALEQTNCKCSNEYVSCNTDFGKVASIFSYEFLKLSKGEKKNFRKDRYELIEYFTQIPN